MPANDGTQDSRESYASQATSTQLDALLYKLVDAVQTGAERFVAGEIVATKYAMIKTDVHLDAKHEILAWADTLAKEVIGEDENERGEFDNPHDQATEDDRNGLREEQRERLSQLLNGDYPLKPSTDILPIACN